MTINLAPFKNFEKEPESFYSIEWLVYVYLPIIYKFFNLNKLKKTITQSHFYNLYFKIT